MPTVLAWEIERVIAVEDAVEDRVCKESFERGSCIRGNKEFCTPGSRFRNVSWTC